jgi:hypothetical protein
MRSCTFLQNFLIRSISTAGWNAAVEYAYTMKVYPLAQATNPGKTTFLKMSDTVYRAAPVFDAEYFDLINMLVQEEPVNDYDKTMLGMAAYIGIEKGKPFKPDAHALEILERAAPAPLLATKRTSFLSTLCLRLALSIKKIRRLAGLLSLKSAMSLITVYT